MEGVQRLRRAGSFQKSDERILGDGDFVENELAEADVMLYGESSAQIHALAGC